MGKGRFSAIASTAPQAQPGYVYVIDPLGAAAGAESDSINNTNLPYVSFPFYDIEQGQANTQIPNEWKTSSTNPGLAGTGWPIRRVGLDADPRPGVNPPTSQDLGNPRRMPTSLAQSIFQLGDDLTVELPVQGDRPGIQRWTAYDNNTPDDPSDDLPLTRANQGNYTWLATVVPATADDAVDSTDSLEALQPAHPGYGQKFYDVSVAVFYKRNPLPSATTERSISAELHQGGELVIYDDVRQRTRRRRRRRRRHSPRPVDRRRRRAAQHPQEWSESLPGNFFSSGIACWRSTTRRH